MVHNNFIYFFKVQGKNKIPDYVQLRDENYKLLAYFRADRPEKALIKCGFESHISHFKDVINSMPFGRMTKISLL